MSNVVAIKQPTRTIDLGDGVEREVKVTLNAMAELEEKYGSIGEAFTKIQDGSISAIRFLLWCILIPEGNEVMSERQIGSLISLDKLNDIMSALMDVMEASMPDVPNNSTAAAPNQQSPANKQEW